MGSVGESAEGYQTAKTLLEMAQAKYERRVLHDFRCQMQTVNQERVAFVDLELWRCQDFVGKVLVESGG